MATADYGHLGPTTVLLVGGPFDGDQHPLKYDVNKKLSIATFTHSEKKR